MPGKKTVQAFWQGQEPVNVAPMAFLRSQIREAQASMEATSALKDAAATNEAAAIWGRFRSALSVAGDVLPRADAKRCGNPIRRLQKRLAAARDIEARIETVCDVLAELPDESFPPGITRLMAVLDGDRRAARAKIAKATRRLVKSKALDELRTAAKRASKQFHKDHGGEKLAVARRRALERVGRQVNRVLACRPSREELAGGKHRHAACAALRRLHDMLEISSRAWQINVDDSITAVNRLLLLSEKDRDCKAAGKSWAKLLSKESKRKGGARHSLTPSETAARPALLQTMEERRGHYGRKLAATWEDLERRQFWQTLHAALKRDAAGALPGEPAAMADAEAERTLPKAEGLTGDRLVTSQDTLPEAGEAATVVESRAAVADASELMAGNLWFLGVPDGGGGPRDPRLTMPDVGAAARSAGPLTDDGLMAGIEPGPGLLLWPYENGQSPVERYCQPWPRNEGQCDPGLGTGRSCRSRLEYPPSAEMMIQYRRQFYQFLPLNCSETGDWELLERYLHEGIGKRCTLFYMRDAIASFRELNRMLNPAAVAG